MSGFVGRDADSCQAEKFLKDELHGGFGGGSRARPGYWGPLCFVNISGDWKR